MIIPGQSTQLQLDDLNWQKRGEYWQKQQAPKPRGRPSPKDRQPLILSGHGVRLSVDRDTLLVQNGFTHYPQQRKEWRFFASERRRLPARIVILDGSGGLSFDVMAWLANLKIPLVQINWKGEVVTMLGGTGHSADSRMVEAQRTALHNGEGFQLAVELIRDKITGCMETLTAVLPVSPVRERALAQQRRALTALPRIRFRTMETLRLVEGRAALAYFRAWQSIPMRWKGIGRRPIPDEWQRVGLRQSSVSGTNRHATHPVNAVLNYAYGVLETEVRIAVVAAGLDPTIGYLHACRPGRVALVYDLMEPARPIVERQILEFVRGQVFTPQDFTMVPSGACRLNPQLARRVMELSFNAPAAAEAGLMHYSAIVRERSEVL